MPPSLSHHCLRGEYLGRGEKVSSCLWEERGGKGTSSLASEDCRIRACVKLDLDYLDQQHCKPKKKSQYGEFTSGLGRWRVNVSLHVVLLLLAAEVHSPEVN